MRLFFFLLVILSQGLASAYANPDLLKKEFQGFTLWLDCQTHHGAVAFYYPIGKDKGNFDLKNKGFRFAPRMASSCQPETWRSYKTTTVNPAEGTWVRGLLVPRNHMDGNRQALKETHYLTNTLPRDSAFSGSKGAWRRTELITECYRDITPLKIWGGVIWGKNTDNDFFMATHGIKTPDFWWKLIYREDKAEYIAWIFPNHWSAKASKIDHFLVSIKELSAVLEFMPEIDTIKTLGQADIVPKKSWPLEISDKTLSCEEHTTSRD